MAKLKAEIDDKRLRKWLNKILDSIPSQALMNRLGLAAIRLIKKRTRKGVDVEDEPFREYSEPYKKVRERAGLPTHPVNLTFNDIDGMMNNIDHLVARDFSKVLVYIKGSRNRRIARYHNVQGAGKSRVIRRFFAINKDEKKKLDSIAQQELKTVLKGLSLGG